MEDIKVTLDSKKQQIRNLLVAGALVSSIVSYAQVSKVVADDISQTICRLYPLLQLDHSDDGKLLEVYRGINNAGRSFSVILGGSTFYNPRDPQGPGAFILKLAKLPAGTRFVLNGKICTLLATIPIQTTRDTTKQG